MVCAAEDGKILSVHKKFSIGEPGTAPIQCGKWIVCMGWSVCSARQDRSRSSAGRDGGACSTRDSAIVSVLPIGSTSVYATPLIDRLRPFFCYFGGKWRSARRYPFPQYPTIVEPFAGGAGYALHYPERRVELYEADPIIFELWSYLIKVKQSEILRLPSVVEHVDDVSGPEAARSLIGFWLNKGVAEPKKTPSVWARSGERPNSFWGPAIKERIAAQVPSIRHWVVKNRSYELARNVRSTWFIDPPYQGECGSSYRYRSIDYGALGEWCRGLQGQILVCEQAGADWLPFQPFRTTKATPGSRGRSYSREVLWAATR